MSALIVAEAGVIGARHDVRHGRTGAVALVDHDVEAFFFKEALVLRIEERGVAALRRPSQLELDRRVLGARGAREQNGSQQRGTYSGNMVTSSTGLDGDDEIVVQVAIPRISSCGWPSR